MTDIEILQSLPSLYPLQDYEVEAINNICNTLKADEDEISQAIKDFNYAVLNGFQFERPCGKWIFTKTIFDKFGNTVKCSSCHKKWKTYDEIRWEIENKYCPNCGARMEGDE